MFILILLALNSLFASCTSADKPTSDKSVDKVETTTNDIASPSAKELLTNTQTTAPTVIQVNSTLETVKVSVEQPKVATTPKEVVSIKEPVTASPVKTIPDAVEEVKEETKTTMEAPITKTVEIKKPAVSHADFNALLQKHVKNGLVNYAGFKADGAKFDAYLDYLSNNAPSTSDKSKSALAFWMNAYNAYTIKLIVDNLPVASIRDLHNGKPWDKKWITIGGESYSLNNIEHDIIRPVFNEPRIHFAIVCAALSCPPLDNKAFTADTVDSHLDNLSKSFINNPKFNTITESKVTITPIMDWYGKDFDSVLGFVQQYANITVGDKAKVKFTDYDWSLNKQ